MHQPASVCHLFLLSLLLLCLLVAHTSAVSSAYSIDNSAGVGLPYDGVGALSAGASSRLLPDYIEPYRSHILDYLFLPSFGASLHVLKVEIGGDAQSTEGTEASHMHIAEEENYQRGYEWWLMKEAKARNPSIALYGLSWGFPHFVLGNQSASHSQPLTNATADYTVRWLLAARDVHGLSIDYVGVWNEREYTADYILALHATLRAHGLPTQIVAADDCCPPWGVCDDLLGDAALSAAVSFVGGHYPNQALAANCTLLPQRKWSSEDFSSEYTAGGCWARLLNRNYVYSNFTSTIAWSPIAAYYDSLPYSKVGLMHAAEPWSGHYDVDQALWATAHTTHHVALGWRYLAHGAGVGVLSGGGTYVSLTDGRGGLTIVVEAVTHERSKCINDGYAPDGTAVAQNVTFALGGSFRKLARLHVFRSSLDPALPVVMYEYRGVVTPDADGSFNFTLAPDTLYTFSTVNSTKGAHAPPPASAAFPARYADSFDRPTLYRQPRYLTDQSGVLEWHRSRNASHGGVVRQSVPIMPIGWCGDASLAYSVVGDHAWRAVNVSVDALVESTGAIALVTAAVASGGCTGADGAPAISFGVTAGGGWTLSNSTSQRYVVASGGSGYEAGAWYRLRLSVGQDSIEASIDGRVVHTESLAGWVGSGSGWAGVGSSFDYVQFDNFEVEGAVAAAVPGASSDAGDELHRAASLAED